jgi:hypothetical protein
MPGIPAWTFGCPAIYTERLPVRLWKFAAACLGLARPVPTNSPRAGTALYLTHSLPARYHAWYCTAFAHQLGL